MNFLQIAITNKCNFSCWHCPMGMWRNHKDRWPLCNEELIPWLNKYIIPERNNWVIELTGGEPSLYDGILELLEFLNNNKIHTLVKTNGTGKLPHYENVKLVAAFHKLDSPPTNFDEYLIIDKIDSEAKVKYCIENNIPYKIIGYNKENFDNSTHGFQFCTFVNPAGHTLRCCADFPIERVKSDGLDHGRIKFIGPRLRLCCSHCKAAIDAWRFIPDSWK